ncbi:MAG TPA: HEAT repeat domain-containing protein, partial [Fimbriimonadaceae bacterium]|nr:HEAT repeat domain-containing protein [Fimbriimonadaceae bacterium]
MKWLWAVCAVIALVVVGGTFLIARSVAVAPRYSSVGYRSGPEWDKLKKARSEGKAGWSDLQTLMDSKDTSVAYEAMRTLVTGTEDSAKKFFEELPKLSSSNKDIARYQSFDDRAFTFASSALSGGTEEERVGAALFVRMNYGGSSVSTAVRRDLFETLVDSMDSAKGDYAKDLAFTIAEYSDGDLSPLLEKLKSKDAVVRKMAVQALGKSGRQDALANVRAMKNDRNKAVKAAAALAESS